MSDLNERLTRMAPDEAASFAMDNNLADLFADAEVAPPRPPAKMVTTLRIDLTVQREIEAAAATRGIGSSTLMRQIIEEWVEAHRLGDAPDQVGELVRHLEAAKRAAEALRRPAA